MHTFRELSKPSIKNSKNSKVVKFLRKKKKNMLKLSRVALAGVAPWIELGLRTKGLQVRFPVRAHAWVAGQVPIGGHARDN